MSTRQVLYPASSNYDVSLRGVIGDVVRSHYLADTSNLLREQTLIPATRRWGGPHNYVTATNQLLVLFKLGKKKMLAKILRGTTSHVTIANCIIFSRASHVLLSYTLLNIFTEGFMVFDMFTSEVLKYKSLHYLCDGSLEDEKSSRQCVLEMKSD